MRRGPVRTVILTVVGVIVVIAVAAAIFIYSGAFNVAAVGSHFRPMEVMLEATMDRSVRAHAADVSAPPSYTPEMVADGFDHYHEMCVVCHGAPGVDRGEIGQGLYPDGPKLARAASDWDDRELFWIIKNGIQSSGMPGFGPTHDDQKIWGIVAFLRKLEHMTPQQYQALVAQAKAEGDEGEHDHDHASDMPMHVDPPGTPPHTHTH